MRVFAISSSPRKGGNSDVLCDRFLEGAKDAGHETEKIRLAEKQITPCLACYHCLQDEHECAQKDDMSDLQQKMIEADVIVLASPVYFYSLCAQLKVFIDRCLPHYREMENKQFYFIVTAADPQHEAAEETIAAMRGFLKCLPGAMEKGIVYGTGTWDKGDVYKHPALEKAYEMGKEVEVMENIKSNFGFGCMRLPMSDGKVDDMEFTRMVDAFLENGFHYFDTAHGYLGGESEKALKRCLTDRYPREKYILTNKLSVHFFSRREDIRPVFEQQLAACGVEYFDYYLMHAQTKELFEKFKQCQAYETALQLKEEGKIRHFGISFHDRAEILEQILTEYPQIEVVQIQLNYVDYEDPAVQSRRCYEVCEKFGKPVLVMEPVKGGNLVNLPPEATAIYRELHEKRQGKAMSNASYAIRFAAGFESVKVVLSGMSSYEQLMDNISYMKDFMPLDAEEQQAVERVCEIVRSKNLIPCTACRYCTDGCPRNISIPDLFACYNARTAYHDWNADYYYHNVHTVQNGKASDCVRCGKCEAACPQHLHIRDLLVDVANAFDRK